ncbi:unnamed protein product [Camellia sinensis]
MHILDRSTPVRPAESDQPQRSASGDNGSNRRATAATEVIFDGISIYSFRYSRFQAGGNLTLHFLKILVIMRLRYITLS